MPIGSRRAWYQLDYMAAAFFCKNHLTVRFIVIRIFLLLFSAPHDTIPA